MLWATYNSPTVTALEMQNGIDNFIINMKLQNCLVDTGVFNMLNLCSVTGIQNIEALKHLNVYPNPASTAAMVNLHIAQASSVSLKLIDFAGKVMSEKAYGSVQGDYQINLNTSNLKAGIYVVELTVNGQTISKKLIIE